MGTKIRIFKSLQEQETFHKELMAGSAPADRFRRLLQMQRFGRLLHPVTDKSRKIIIRKWTS